MPIAIVVDGVTRPQRRLEGKFLCTDERGLACQLQG